jgi:hypothetical protein
MDEASLVPEFGAIKYYRKDITIMELNVHVSLLIK